MRTTEKGRKPSSITKGSLSEDKLKKLERRLDDLTSQGQARDAKLVELRLKIELESLLSKIAEANVLIGKADRHIKLIRDEVYQAFAEEVKVIMEAFQAKNNLAKDIFKDFIQTIASLQSGPITISPHYSRTEAGIKKARQKAKDVSTKLYDEASPLIESPFGTIEQERERLTAMLSDIAEMTEEGEVKPAFHTLFQQIFDELEKIHLFCEKLKNGQSRSLIRAYYLKSYAATCFKAHIEDRQDEHKGVIIELARYVYNTLGIDYPLPKTKLSMVIKKPDNIKILVDGVINRESRLAVELNADIEALSKRPLSARPDTSYKGRCDIRRSDPGFLGMVSSAKKAEAAPVSVNEKVYDDDFEVSSEDEVETDIEEVETEGEDEIEEALEVGGEDKSVPFEAASKSSKIGTFYTSQVRRDGARILSKDRSSHDPMSRRWHGSKEKKRIAQDGTEDAQKGKMPGHRR